MQKGKEKKGVNGSKDPEENLEKLKELRAKERKVSKANLRKKISLG